MIHSFNKYTIQLERYQLQPISPWIVPYEARFKNSLATTIRIFQKELNWSEMWNVKEAHERLEKGYRFFVLKPKSQILGWVWVAPDHEIKNLYVRPYRRFNPKRTNSNKHWGTQLIFAGLNCCFEQEFPDAYFRVDVWNSISNHMAEKVLSQIGCRSNIELVEENY